MLAENRYLNDKISQVDALEEEIAIYKVSFSTNVIDLSLNISSYSG